MQVQVRGKQRKDMVIQRTVSGIKNMSEKSFAAGIRMSAGTAKLLAHLWSPEPLGLPHVPYGCWAWLCVMWGHHGHCWACPDPSPQNTKVTLLVSTRNLGFPASWTVYASVYYIAVYTSVLSTWCQGGMSICLLHPGQVGNQLRVQKAESTREICNPSSFTREEVLPLYLSRRDTGAPQNPPKDRSWECHVPGECLILPTETEGHLGFLLGAWRMRDGSLQLECLPHWRITHSVWVPARSRMVGCCLTGLGLLLQVQICKSWHIPFSCKQQSPSWLPGMRENLHHFTPPSAEKWSGQAHRMSCVAISWLWPGREKNGEKT